MMSEKRYHTVTDMSGKITASNILKQSESSFYQIDKLSIKIPITLYESGGEIRPICLTTSAQFFLGVG
jgi:hypothetical protein